MVDLETKLLAKVPFLLLLRWKLNAYLETGANKDLQRLKEACKDFIT